MRCNSDLVGVLVTESDRRLVAIRGIPAGTMLFRISGRETPAPTRYSLQIGPGNHIDQSGARSAEEIVRRFFWRYMNHHCDPTTNIRALEVIAQRDIARGGSVTFDYNTTELELAEPFRCHCGSAQCVGVVRGARHLTAEQRARLAERLPDYLR